MKYLALQNIIPQIMLASSAMLVLIVLIIKRNHTLISTLTVILLLLCAASVIWQSPGSKENGWLFAADGIGNMVVFLVISSAVVVTVLSFSYLEKHDINKEEYYLIMILGTLGASALAVANHFVTFILGLELLSISIYIMTGYLKRWDNVVEASVKYLILASVSSAFLLMGMAFLYAGTGSMNFDVIGTRISVIMHHSGIFLPAGIGLMLVGIGFKIGVVPFHMWIPEIYHGSPAPAAAFIASASKASVVAVALRFFVKAGGYHFPALLIILSVIAVLSMLTGNILALLQKNVKRILGYSSIAHFGYILVSFVAGGKTGAEAVIFYLLVYIISILGAFGIIILMSGEKKDAQDLSEFRGLFWRHPWQAAILTAMLLSLAGIPLTAGFIGKFYILSSGLYAGYVYLAVILVITSVAGLFYYLRIITEMFKESEGIQNRPVRTTLLFGGSFMLTLLFILVVWIGLNPGAIARLIHILAGNFIS